MRNLSLHRLLLGIIGTFLLLSLENANTEAATSAKSNERILIVVGAAGQDQYEQQFANWVANWKQIASHKQAELTIIGESVDARFSDLELLQKELQRETDKTTATWLILMGHGTFDGKSARFNLRGPDVTADQLSEFCDSVEHPLAVIHCFSASGPFLKALSADKRVIITATKNGHEFYFSRFGGFLAEAATQQQTDADLDHDGQVSLLEAYLSACRATNVYYQQKGELATEHALLDDNADQSGTRGNQFQGLFKAPDFNSATATLPDGHRAHQFILSSTPEIELLSGEQKQKRDELEIKILELKQRKESFSSLNEYYLTLEPLMVQLSQIYRKLDKNKRRVIYDPLVIPANAKKTGK